MIIEIEISIRYYGYNYKKFCHGVELTPDKNDTKMSYANITKVSNRTFFKNVISHYLAIQ
jgi:hypothetical protein